jgi:hypothetical protein
LTKLAEMVYPLVKAFEAHDYGDGARQPHVYHHSRLSQSASSVMEINNLTPDIIHPFERRVHIISVISTDIVEIPLVRNRSTFISPLEPMSAMDSSRATVPVLLPRVEGGRFDIAL